MTADPGAVQALFVKAIEITDLAEREQLLAAECAGDPELYERVSRLLAAFDSDSDFLDQPTRNVGATQMVAGESHQPGQIIAGRYKLLEVIGEGGMGSVWVAEQTKPIRRKVALKLVKPGMDSKQVLARFDAERQALALMDHPNIARVFDGGVTEQGRPYFAMEYVKGMPLTEYCDQMRLSVEERLRLFVPICQAVQHAHQKGIIHRDLKPSNVLICLYDGKPVPKVIDFGLAKAMHQPLTEQTVHTGHGLMIGTPLYMSPEQAEHNNLDVDTRTDVYSLGVMLYELLTGSTPLEKASFKNAAFGEILRLIKEVEPPKPSTRVSSSAQLPNIAAQRSLDPVQLGKSIRGDLDWIVMKAIEKERERRYETANGLARDLERFLNMEVVEACPPSARYRLRRLMRKHRTAITSAAAFAAILVLGTGFSVWQAVRATRAESLAGDRLNDVEAEQIKTQAALETSQINERRARDSETAAVTARKAEEQAKLAEGKQRELAEQQRDQAQRLQVEATSKSNQLLELTEQQRRVIYASEMSQVRIEAQRGNLARMREILLSQLPIDGKPDLRGFEWHYWYRYLNQAQVVRKFETASTDAWGSALVRALPGGEHVAWSRGSETTIVSLLNGSSRTFPFQLRHYADHTPFSASSRAVVGAAYSSQAYQPGRKVEPPPGVTEGSISSCTVFDATGQERVLPYPQGAFSLVSYLDISSDGTRVAVLGNDATHTPDHPVARLCVWNVDSGELILNQSFHREINRFALSPDHQSLVAFVSHGTQRHADVVRDVAVVIDLATGQETAVARYDDDIEVAFWLPDSKRLLLATLGFSGASRKQLLSWDSSDLSQQPTLLTKEPTYDWTVGAVSNNGGTVAITSHTVNSIQLLDTRRGDLLDTLHTGGKGITSVAFSPDDQQLLATTVDGEVLSWDLGSHDDLFALRTKPLPTLAKNGYVLSRDQSLLAVALADGSLRVRTRTGEEYQLREAIPAATGGAAFMAICPNNRYLAFRTTIDLDGKTFPSGQGLLELYDLQERKRLWQRACSFFAPLTRATQAGTAMAFSSDGSQLVHVEKNAIVTLDCRTGRGTGFRNQLATNRGIAYLGVNTNSFTGDVSAAFPEVRADGDVTLVHFDPVRGEERGRFSIGHGAVMIYVAPDGRHCTVLRPGLGVEIWNLPRKDRILYVPGTVAVFSPDAKRVAISGVAVNSQMAANSAEARGVAIWDLETRQQVSELKLNGDLPDPDETKFSLDGKRILTLHGKNQTTGGKIPHGRLWDVETGREILDIPIADVNHYIWDLVFDQSGEILTALVLSKAVGTLSGGTTAVYDARPLAASVDSELAADRLMEQLQATYALKREWIDEVESRTGLDMAIREATLNRIRTAEVNPAEIARMTREIVSLKSRSAEDFQRALTWAEELNRLEPDTLRSRVLLGAAYYRLGKLDEALDLVLQAPQRDGAASEPNPDDERIRLAILGLIHQSRGDRRAAQIALESLPQDSPNREWTVVLLTLEAQQVVPQRMQPTPQASMPPQANVDRLVANLLKAYGNGQPIELATNPDFNRWRIGSYDADNDKRLSREELLKALDDNYRYGRSCVMLAGLAPETQLEFLDEVTRVAPNFLTARFVRAWIRATCPDPQFRSAALALAEATTLCERTKYQDPVSMEALAAASAESGDFDAAVRWQTEALRLYGQKMGVRTLELGPEYEDRLMSYQEHRPIRTRAIPQPYDLISFFSTTAQGSVDASAPLLTPDDVFRSRRISGWGAAWSPDGKQIVRSLKYNDPKAPLEIVDLETGATRQFAPGGVDPVWAKSPVERIYFVRGPANERRAPINEMIWQCDPSGENLSKLCDGGYPSLTPAGRIFVRQLSLAGRKIFLKGFQLDENGAPLDVGTELPLSTFYPSVNPGGTLAAVSTSDDPTLHILNIETGKEVPAVPTHAMGSTILGGWSPDGRYFAYGSTSSRNPSLWLLDITTGEQRRLTDTLACNPRWSPDGRYIAADERDKNQVVILDISSLHLEQGLEGDRQ